MIKCPKCGEILAGEIKHYGEEEVDYVEVELMCENEHLYFIRIRVDDLRAYSVE